MSLMNTMCLSSLCTWEKFIRSCLLKMKTAPHVDPVCHCLNVTEIVSASITGCGYAKVHSSCGVVCVIPEPSCTHTAGCF